MFLTWTWQKQPTIALKQVTTDQLCWKCTQSLCKFPALQFYSTITQNTLVLLVVLSSAIISKDMLSFLIRSHFSCPRETPQFEPTDITSEAERLLLLCSTSIFPADPQHPIYFIVISINKNTPEGLKTNKQEQGLFDTLTLIHEGTNFSFQPLFDSTNRTLYLPVHLKSWSQVNPADVITLNCHIYSWDYCSESG